MIKKISNKIILVFTVLIFLLLIFLLLIFNNNARKTHLSVIKREMLEKISFIELVILKKSNINNSQNSHQLNKLLEEISNIINLRITIVRFDGTVLADSDVQDISKMDNHLKRLEIINSLKENHGESIRYSNTLKTEMLYSAKKSNTYIIRLAKSLQEIDETLWGMRKIIILLSLLVLLISFVIITYISKKITRPIDETINFAKHFSKGDYSKRILNYSNDEIGVLQLSLNQLADIIVDKIDNLIFEQKKLQITIESIHDGIAVIDFNKKLIIDNNSFNRLLHIEKSGINNLYHESIKSKSLNSKIKDALENGTSSKFEEDLYEDTRCEIIINPIKDKKTIQGILLIIHDITDKKKIEQIKTDLVANMSHELKTPVTILKGYIETIQNNFGSKEMVNDFLNKALSNVERQNSIINDILKLNRLETSNDFHKEVVNIRDVVDYCIEILKPKAEKKNITITKINDFDGIIITGNRFLVEEIIFNIIDNAINYNKNNGSIIIEQIQHAKGTIFKFTDTGIGIPEESLERIFERFYRVDKGRSRATGGTGLGLSIVKHAAELLKWQVEVESDTTGTSFIVNIENQDNY